MGCTVPKFGGFLRHYTDYQNKPPGVHWVRLVCPSGDGCIWLKTDHIPSGGVLLVHIPTHTGGSDSAWLGLVVYDCDERSVAFWWGIQAGSVPSDLRLPRAFGISFWRVFVRESGGPGTRTSPTSSTGTSHRRRRENSRATIIDRRWPMMDLVPPILPLFLSFLLLLLFSSAYFILWNWGGNAWKISSILIR